MADGDTYDPIGALTGKNPDGTPYTGPTSANGSSKPSIKYQEGADGRVYQSVDGGPFVLAQGLPAPTQTPRKNLGNGVFEDATGVYVEEPVQGYMGTGIPAEPARRYLTQAEQKQLLNPDTGGSDGVGWANLAQRRSEFDQQFALEQAQWEEELRLNQEAQAQAQVEMDFLRQKEEAANAFNDKKLALDTQAQIFTQQSTMASLQQQRQTMELDRAIQQAQMQLQVDQFNAEMGFNVQQANTQAQAQKRAELAQNARDVASYSESPTDWGKLAAFELANRGGGFATDEQADFTSDKSLQPLASGLENRGQIQGSPDNPYSFNPLTAPMIPALGAAPDLAAILAGFQSGTPGGLVDTAQRPTAQELLGQGAVPTAGTASDFEDRSTTSDENKSYFGAKGVPDWALQKMEQGGMVQGAYMSGDSTDGKPNPEINIPNFPVQGMSTIIPADKVTPELRKHLAKFATGGVFDAGLLAPQKDTTQARQFQTQAAQRARQGTPWQTGALPGYTFASSPGLDQSVIDLIASLRGVEYGEDPGYFMRQAAQRAPVGMGQRVVGRSG